MNLLPIVHRDLRLAARKPITYYSRSLAGMVAASVSLGVLFAGLAGMINSSSMGQGILVTLSAIAYTFVLFEGTIMAADALSREKREGTLGLLFLTDLKAHDIIFGKLIPRLGRSVYSLMATLPATAIPFLFGGISAIDFVCTSVALLNTLFFCASFGMLISAASRDPGQSVNNALLGVAFFGIAMPAAGLWLNPSSTALYLVPTPAGAFLAGLANSLGPIAGPAQAYFGWSLVTSHLMAWFFLACAGHILPFSFREKPEPRLFRTIKNFRRMRQKSPSLTPFISDDAEFGPAFLLTCRLRHPRRTVNYLSVLILFLFVGAYCANPLAPLEVQNLAIIGLILHAVLKYIAAEQACRALLQPQRTGELELLLTTPFDEDHVLRGCLLGLRRRLIAPVLLVFGVDLFILFTGWWKLGMSEGLGWAVICLLEIGWTIGNLYALTWVGILMGMKSNSHGQAIRRTLFYVLVIPWLALVCAYALLGVFSTPSQLAFPAILLFLILASCCNLGFTGHAISELRDRFRELAAHQFLPAPAPLNKKKVFKLFS